MKICEFKRLDKGEPCIWCGRPTLVTPYKRYVRKCTAAQKEKLGDRVARMLKSIHITEEGYKRAKEMFGAQPTCNCQARRRWLNKVSDWWRGIEDKPL